MPAHVYGREGRAPAGYPEHCFGHQKQESNVTLTSFRARLVRVIKRECTYRYSYGRLPMPKCNDDLYIYIYILPIDACMVASEELFFFFFQSKM